jgi:hypothetical protein
MDSVEFGTRILIFIIVSIIVIPLSYLVIAPVALIFRLLCKIFYRDYWYWDRDNLNIEHPIPVRIFETLLFIPVIYFVYYVSSLIW